VGIVASVGLFALNEWCVPRSMAWTARILNRYVQKPENPANKNIILNFGFTNSREHRSWFASEYHLNTSEMLKPQVNWNLPDGSNRRVYADRAIFTNGVWTFFNVSQYSQANSTAQLVPMTQSNLNVLAMPEFSETPAQIRSEIKISAYLSITKAGKADIPLADIFDYLRLHPHPTGEDAAKLLTKFHARLAAPWTCLVVVLIAIPFGAASGRRNLFFGVAGSIFICFGYFVIQQISVAFGMGGHLPPWLAAWLPNMIFGAAGLILMLRVR
jgi:lipopolysaccharide export system permease protein